MTDIGKEMALISKKASSMTSLSREVMIDLLKLYDEKNSLTTMSNAMYVAIIHDLELDYVHRLQRLNIERNKDIKQLSITDINTENNANT